MHVLLVEDERRLVTLLHRVLTEEMHTVDAAYDGQSGFEMALDGTYDLVILDLMLPLLDGMAVCRKLRAEHVQTPILMLTARESVQDRVAGLRAGADDYLVKPFAMQELLARADALFRRSSGQANREILRVGDISLDVAQRIVRRGDREIELTAKEFTLLEYLMRHPGQVLSRAQILDNVWGYDAEAVSNVVDIYIHYLRDKIDRGKAASLIKTVRGIGYRICA